MHFFSAAEIAFVSINQGKMAQKAQEGDKRAIKVMRLLENSDEFLATIQVAITFAGFFSSASAATSFSSRIQPLLGNIPGAETLALVIVTVVLSYLTLVLGNYIQNRWRYKWQNQLRYILQDYFVCQKDCKTIRLDFDVLNRIIKTNDTN